MTHPSPTLDSLKAVWRQDNSPKNHLTLCAGVELMRGRVHEVQGMAADGFAAALISKTVGTCLWIGRRNDVYSLSPLALSRYFDPSRLVLTECLSRKEILWAADQALRSKGFECVILHLGQGPNLHESRRLQIAAECGRSTGLVIIERNAQSSAAQTRWQCGPVAAWDDAANDHVWSWECTKNKSGPLSAHHVRWKEDGYAAGYVDMVSRSTS